MATQLRRRQVLIAEPDGAYSEVLKRVVEVYADVEIAPDFPSAYGAIRRRTPDILITNLRLEGTVEGLQLAYVAASSGFQTRVLVYSDRVVPWIMRELHRAGAFFETEDRLEFSLPAFVDAELPVLDRRNPVLPDRRAAYRGGRRASDVPIGWRR